jgi:hypothetical protein
MLYRNEILDVSFSVPDVLTVRKQLRYHSLSGYRGDGGRFGDLWNAALELVEDWKCPLIPDSKALDPDQCTDPNVVTVMIWTGSTVWRHVTQLEAVPKASSPPPSTPPMAESLPTS